MRNLLMNRLALLASAVSCLSLASCDVSAAADDELVKLEREIVHLGPPKNREDFESEQAFYEARANHSKPLHDLVAREIDAFERRIGTPATRVDTGLYLDGGTMLFTFGAITPEASLYVATVGDRDTPGRILPTTRSLDVCRVELDPSVLPDRQVMLHADLVRIFTFESGCTLQGYDDPKYPQSANATFEASPVKVSGERMMDDGTTLRFFVPPDPKGEIIGADVLPIALDGQRLKQVAPLGAGVVLWLGEAGRAAATFQYDSGGYCVLSSPNWISDLKDKLRSPEPGQEGAVRSQCAEWSKRAKDRRSVAYREEWEARGKPNPTTKPVPE